MILVLSGEGATDFGSCTNGFGSCWNQDFAMGPMTVMLEQMLFLRIGYSVCDYQESIHYISEASLSEKTKNPALKRFRGKKQPAETGYFYRNAYALGLIAQDLEKSRHDQVIAILFRDCDGTRSAKPGIWDEKRQSMEHGFKRSGFSRGVPMLPKPKSEAWLLCAFKTSPHHNCLSLEELSGNDASANAPKKHLDVFFERHLISDELCEWLKKYPCDFVCLDRMNGMPSFKAFSDRLYQVVDLAWTS
ncbi:MAG: hypothetical protein H7839_12280 [Magnetococcus sp. YQC-5]